MNRGDLSSLLRSIGILHAVDRFRFFITKIKNFQKNSTFKRENPTVTLPPDYLMYESFNLDYKKYYEDGKDTADWLTTHFRRYKTLEGLNILDWGCGPARVLRHLPQILDSSNTFFGTDYNSKSIQWCKENIPTIHFELNGINPPTVFESDFFDLIYGISIFTHLSEASHHAWLQELLRIARPGSILFFTTHGDAFKSKLSAEESDQYSRNKLIIRGQVKEGHRVFTAFHPPAYMKIFFAQYGTILEHIPGQNHPGKYPEQDVWVLMKK